MMKSAFSGINPWCHVMHTIAMTEACLVIIWAWQTGESHLMLTGPGLLFIIPFFKRATDFKPRIGWGFFLINESFCTWFVWITKMSNTCLLIFNVTSKFQPWFHMQRAIFLTSTHLLQRQSIQNCWFCFWKIHLFSYAWMCVEWVH